MKFERIAPGLVEIEEREVFYIEIQPGEGFREIMTQVRSSNSEVRGPQNGSIGEKGAWLVLEDGRQCMAMDYNGDIPEYRAKLLAYCQSAGRLGGVVRNKHVLLTDGRKIDLRTAKVIFDS